MSIFGKIAQLNREQTCKGVDVADELLKLMFEMGAGDFGKPECLKAKQILEESARKHGGLYDIQEVLLIAIDLVGEPSTPKERRALARAYCLCHAEYTLYAIRAVEDYISNGLDYGPLKNAYKPGMTHEMIEKEYKSQIYAQLGGLYERAHDFDKAEEYYKMQAKIDTWSHFPYLNLSELYRKKNEPDKSISILEKAKHHPSYRPNVKELLPEELFCSNVVDIFLEEAKARKRRNYVYRPRGHKKFLEID